MSFSDSHRAWRNFGSSLLRAMQVSFIAATQLQEQENKKPDYVKFADNRSHKRKNKNKG